MAKPGHLPKVCGELSVPKSQQHHKCLVHCVYICALGYGPQKIKVYAYVLNFAMNLTALLQFLQLLHMCTCL